MRKAQIEKITDYLILTGLMAVSSFPAFCTSQNYILILFCITAFLFLKRSIPFEVKALSVVIPFVIVEVLQFLIVKPFDPIMISGTFIRMFLGLFTVCLLGKKFTKYYSDIIVFFSIVSFFFFVPSIIFPSFFHFCVSTICPYFESPFKAASDFYVIWPTNIIFCFHDAILEEFRNPGPFWEPGMYAVYINIALIFNFIAGQKIFSKQNIILTIALISTFSTAGYIAFFLLIFSFYFIKLNVFKKVVLAAIAIPTMCVLYFSLDFLNSKVEENINLANTTTSSRFGSAKADIEDFSTSPILGWGRGVMRYGGKQYAFFSEDQHRNNSVTDLLATYGIFIFLFYFYNYYRTLWSLCLDSDFKTSFAPFALAVILVLGFSQSIFLRPFFYSLLFLQFMYGNKASSLNDLQLNKGITPTIKS